MIHLHSAASSPVFCAAAIALSVNIRVADIHAADWFNPALLGIGTKNKSTPASEQATSVDEQILQRIANGQQPPGTYVLDLYVNNFSAGRRNITLTADGPENSLTPTWSVNETLSLGIKPESLNDSKQLDMSPDAGDLPIKGILNKVKGALVRLDFSRQRLNVTIPEIYMVKEMSGATDPRFWDEGITAWIADYNFSAWRRQSNGYKYNTKTNSAFLSLTNSLNIGAWRLHNFSTWIHSEVNSKDTEQSNAQNEFESVNTWVERAVPQLRSRVSLGDYYTPSDVFDSIQFQGAQISSDEEMNPDYLNDFAPTLRGTASTNALVTVRQNGNTVYQTSVPPGPFTINDIPSSSQSGDYYVTIREADGKESSFIQGNSSVPLMQRKNEARYTFTGGLLRNSRNDFLEPGFIQGTLIYGLPYNLTIYSGAIGSQKYQASSIGLGALMGILGATSVDVTHAKTDRASITGQEEDGMDSGQSWRVRYSKTISETGSTFAMSALRNSSGEYWSFGDAFTIRNNRKDDFIISDSDAISTPVIHGRTSSEYNISLTQTLSGKFGSLGLNANRKDFHDLEDEQMSVSINWNTNINGIGIGMGYQMSKWPGDEREDEKIVSLTVSLPLQQWLSTSHSMYATSNYYQSDNSRKTMNNSVGGTLLERNNLSWNLGQSSVHAGNNGGEDSNNGNMNLAYSGGEGKVSSGYSYSPDNIQYNLGLQGIILASKYGLTLSQSPGETMALVRAPNANNIVVKNGTGITTDSFGNTIVSVQPYKRNKVDLDVLSAGQNVTLGETSKVVIPTRGAVVLAHYDTAVGYQILMKLTRQGKPLPFGTMVNLVHSNERHSDDLSAFGGNGIVGDGGEVWLSGMPEQGRIKVIWGEGTAGTCMVNYALSAREVKTGEENNLPVMVKGECL